MNKKILPVILVCFCIMILVVYAQDALHVFPTGNVGIGVENATAKLEVGGRIKDKTGFLMPVGSVLPFFGDHEPEGWVLCDGRELSRNEYADLYSVIGISCGHGDEVTTFNIPDLRGMFLRGVDDMKTPEGAAGRDPDVETREELKPGGNTGNTVGSKQEDALQKHKHDDKGHTHSIHYWAWSVHGSNRNNLTTGHNSSSSFIDPGYANLTDPVDADDENARPVKTSIETRPKNVAVNYIIKY